MSKVKITFIYVLMFVAALLLAQTFRDKPAVSPVCALDCRHNGFSQGYCEAKCSEDIAAQARAQKAEVQCIEDCVGSDGCEKKCKYY